MAGAPRDDTASAKRFPRPERKVIQRRTKQLRTTAIEKQLPPNRLIAGKQMQTYQQRIFRRTRGLRFLQEPYGSAEVAAHIGRGNAQLARRFITGRECVFGVASGRIPVATVDHRLRQNGLATA